MIIKIAILLSVTFLTVAAALALRLFWRTGKGYAWISIAIAFALLAAGNVHTLMLTFADDVDYTPGLLSALTTLLVSGLIAAGMAALTPLRTGDEMDNWRGENIYHMFVETSPDPIGIHCDGIAVYANPACLKLFGADSPEQILGKRIMDFIHPDDKKTVGERIGGILRDGKATPSMNHRMLRLDGSVLYIETRGAPFTYKGKKAILGIMRDVTERKVMEDKLQQVLTEKDSVLENAVVGIVYLKDRKIAWVNQKARQLFEFPEDKEVLGLSTEVVHVSKDNFEKLGKEAYPLIAQGKTFDTEMVVKRIDGSRFWARLFGKAIDPEDLSKGVVWLVDDVTDRKQAEEDRSRLMTALEQTADTVVITDAEGSIQYVNPAFEKTTGYSRPTALGKNPRILKSGKHDKAFYRDMWESLKKGDVWSGYVVNRKKDGSLYEQEMSVSPVFDHEGEISNFVAISRDVTREAMLFKARDYFTAVTSHELRTPLSKLELVKMLLEGVESGSVPPEKLQEIKALVATTYSNFDRVIYATSLISDLVTRGGRDTMTSLNFYFDLLYCVEKARAGIDSEKRKVSISLNMDPQIKNAKILSDANLFRSAIDEALSNAIKYSPDGGNVTVSTRVRDDNALIDIIDEGIGIPEDKKDQVLEPYFSLENPLHHSTAQYKHMGGGMGLGLTIIRMIVETHKGGLEIHSKGPGLGTTLTVSFPLVS